MPRVKKVVGRRQNLRADRLTEFGDEAAKKVRQLIPYPTAKSKGRAGRNGSRAALRGKRLTDVWAEQDAEREMHGSAADGHFFAGMDDVGDK